MKPIDAVFLFGSLAAIFLIQETDGVVWTALKLKTKIYNTMQYNSSMRQGYFNLPRNIYQLKKLRAYEQVAPENDFPYAIDFYCPINDSIVCLMFDKRGIIAGIQLSFLEEEFKNILPDDYDYSGSAGFIKTNFYNRSAYSVRVYFTNPCTLGYNGRLDITETAEVLWTKINGTWVKFDRCQPNGPRMGDFYMQGCYPRLGQIYVYKFHQHSTCNDAFFLYVSYDRGSLVEFGIFAVGHGVSSGYRDWYAHPTREVLAKLLPAVPKCFNSLWKYGFTSLQVYLIDNPDSIKCLKCTQ